MIGKGTSRVAGGTRGASGEEYGKGRGTDGGVGKKLGGKACAGFGPAIWQENCVKLL